jgi:hypothetical protein
MTIHNIFLTVELLVWQQHLILIEYPNTKHMWKTVSFFFFSFLMLSEALWLILGYIKCSQDSHYFYFIFKNKTFKKLQT